MAKIVASQQQGRNGIRRASGFRASPSQHQAAEIERLAYQFFVERGYEHGHDREDWLRAEAIVRKRQLS